MSKANFTFFWKSPLSQWHKSPITDTYASLQITFNCAEQFMMWHKAILFNDLEIAEQILATDSPRVQKSLGRKVKNFNQLVWDKIAKQVVYEGNLLKFTQNPDLKQILLDTAGTELVEANPYDTVWSIGMRANDPRALDKSLWLGKNWLGEMLTQVRDDIINLKKGE